MLAQRVSSINSLSAFCEATEADIDEVGPMFEIQFDDGVVTDAFADELEN